MKEMRGLMREGRHERDERIDEEGRHEIDEKIDERRTTRITWV